MIFEEIINTPSFGVALSLITYSIGLWIYKRFRSPLANPLVIATIIIISLLMVADIDFEKYHLGARMIEFLLGPATVGLAIPIYKHIHRVKKDLPRILLSIIAGAISSVLSIVYLSKALGADEIIIRSIASKSVTTPIAIEVTEMLGGIPPLTVVFVMITGITGALIGPEFCKLIGIRSREATGLAIGSSSHGAGTSRAIVEGEVEGAMSSLAMALMGLFTAIVTPFLMRFLL